MEPQLIADTSDDNSGVRSTIGAYAALVKPRIIELLLITTLPAMVLAARGWPGLGLVSATLVGGVLSAGGANALNNVIDRDIDEVMKRTRGRPLPSHRVKPRAALVFGVVLGASGFVWLWQTTTLLAGLIATASLLFYVFFYTMYLKRRTVENIVIGGAAGGAPALVGWAAVTGSLELAPWVMFLIVFLWTPPHFWALSLRFKDEYEAAGVPMLPVVYGVEATTRRILVYSGATVLASLALVPIGGVGWVYLTAAVIMGSLLLVESMRLVRTPARAMTMFMFSNIYLATLFASAMVDVLV